MTPTEYKQKVLTISRGFQMSRDIEDCAQMAAKNPLYLSVLRSILNEIVENHDWQNPHCARILHILINSETSGSLFHILDFVKRLPENVPFALVELLGSLLPSYKKIVLGPAKDLCESEPGSPQRAVGIQTLCNLHLDGLLPGENLPYLADLLKGFEVDPFFTDYLVDLVRSTVSFRDRGKVTVEAAPDLTDILIEIGDD